MHDKLSADEDKTIGRATQDSADRRFRIDKTHASLFEAGKNRARASLTWVMFTIISTLLAFSEINATLVEVPVIGLKIDRWLTAELCVLILCAAYLRHIALTAHHQLLEFQLDALLTGDQELERPTTWYLCYPSFFKYIQISENLSHTMSIPLNAFRLAFWIFTFIVPVVVLIKIGIVVSFALHWIATALTAVVLLALGKIILMSMPDWDQQHALLKKLRGK
ncbi:MAG: hypothetical protein IID44_07800 [Planctomycetes bacterium]|nr:hypothetical protein [Planctomycetota bacterium]